MLLPETILFTSGMTFANDIQLLMKFHDMDGIKTKPKQTNKKQCYNIFSTNTIHDYKLCSIWIPIVAHHTCKEMITAFVMIHMFGVANSSRLDKTLTLFKTQKV